MSVNKVFNFFNKKFVDLFMFFSYISTYAIASILSLGPRSPKYLLSGPLQKNFAASGPKAEVATQIPKGPDMKTSSWVYMNLKLRRLRQKCLKAFRFSPKESLSPPEQSICRLALAFRVPVCDSMGFPAGVWKAPTLPPVTEAVSG